MVLSQAVEAACTARESAEWNLEDIEARAYLELGALHHQEAQARRRSRVMAGDESVLQEGGEDEDAGRFVLFVTSHLGGAACGLGG
jgi:hypothetical protein